MPKTRIATSLADKLKAAGMVSDASAAEAKADLEKEEADATRQRLEAGRESGTLLGITELHLSLAPGATGPDDSHAYGGERDMIGWVHARLESLMSRAVE
jgi:hypothetical protein